MDTTYISRAFFAALTGFAFAACGGGDTGGGEAGGGETGGEQMAPAVDPSTAGNIAGSITFEGEPPAMEAIDMSSEAACAAKHTETPMTQAVVVNPNGTLANVFVYVKEGLGDRTFPTPSDSPVLDQDGCRYHPHVLGLQAGQELTIRNSDPVLHNINATPSANRPFNISQPVEGMTSTRTFAVEEVMIPVRCDAHGWMNAYLGVLSHPYFAVSGEDGSFDISTLPPGDYVIEAWHERYGVQTQNVTVATGETAQVQFTFSEAMAANAVVPLGEPLILHHGEMAEHTDGAR